MEAGLTTDLRELFCADCGEVRLFMTPPCEDGHGAECPDLCCLDCGFALTGATWGLLDDETVAVSPSRAA